jgi:ribosome biogenesis GTPase
VVLFDDGTEADATVPGALRGRTKTLGNAVVVGDRVALEPDADRLVVTGVEPRRNTFSRRAAGRQAREQVVAANVDQVVLVASLAEPEFKAGLADRILGQAEHSGIPGRLVVNKVDLGDPADAGVIADDYGRAGYPAHVLCARNGEGVEALRHACLARRSLFVGHSGVGKSSLLNALVKGLGLMAGSVNPKTGKGRHTTTAAWLVRPGPGFELIDTPGFRAFGLWGIGPDDLDQAYPEFRRFLGACRFGDCRHDREPGCAVREASEGGAVSPRRHASFLKLRRELLEEVPS